MSYLLFNETTSTKISKYLHPLTFVNASSWIVNIYIYHNPIMALVNPIILLLYLIPGIVYIKIEKRRTKGTYSRSIAFIILLIGFLGAIFTYIVTETPVMITQDAIIAFIVIAFTMIINRFWWDISFHSAIPMCCVALLFPVSVSIAASFFVLALIVGLSRIPLKQHTIQQVVAGWTFGFCFTSILLIISSHTYQ